MIPFFPPNSKGFELAISTLVVMILGVLVVGGGIALLAKIMMASEDLNADLPTRHLDELRERLTEGQLVATVPSNQKVVAGEAVTFGLAVKNALDTKTFTIDIKGKDENDADVTFGTGATQWSKVLFTDLTIEGGQEAIAKIIVVPGKNVPQGTYTFIVKVMDGAEVYDSARFFTVAVQ
jgi:hypothetical protein